MIPAHGETSTVHGQHIREALSVVGAPASAGRAGGCYKAVAAHAGGHGGGRKASGAAMAGVMGGDI